MSNLADILIFIGAEMAVIFAGLDAVYFLDSTLSLLDVWIAVMLIGIVMDFITEFIYGYYS